MYNYAIFIQKKKAYKYLYFSTFFLLAYISFYFKNDISITTFSLKYVHLNCSIKIINSNYYVYANSLMIIE